jgi:hypothetical protein
MATADDITFHSKRAMVELDMATRAASTPAARAHFSLSTLHLERMRRLCEGEGISV